MTRMDTLQKQLSALNDKVDGLHQLIEQLSSRLSEVVSDSKIGSEQGQRFEVDTMIGQRYHRHPFNSDHSLEHKDVLSDDGSVESSNQNNDRQLSPEVQIQRLTAQLTAAYSRIAALEEQLIARRIHS